MGSQLWLFRDANWSPDFPTSAHKAAELYTYGLGVPVDGVIGLNQKTVQAIIEAIGPIEVEPGQPPVDASNLTDYMRAAWAPPPGVTDVNAWIAGRKDFIGKVMQAALARVQNDPGRLDWPRLGRAVLEALESRDLLVWIDDPDVAAILSERGWDGAVRSTTGDYWMVVDANVGFNKVNTVITSSIAYTMTLNADGSADADMMIQYRHTGDPTRGCEHSVGYTLALSYEALIRACYWDYVRVYVPDAAQLTAMSSHPVPADYLVMRHSFDGRSFVEHELGKTVFATLFVLEQGQTVNVSLSYRLPAGAAWDSASGQYHLTMQRQAGAAPRGVSVTLIWPDGYVLSQANLPLRRMEAQMAEFDLELSADRSLSSSWTRGTLSSPK